MASIPGTASRSGFFLFRFGMVLVLLFLAGCSQLSIPDRFIGPTAVPEDNIPTEVVETPLPPTPTPTPAGPITLQIWLPPDFDPALGTPASNLLQARLKEFSSRRPGVRLDVRIKSLDDPGGMLNALTTASAAATTSLPDLVALPRSLTEAAALKGLLYPFDGLTAALEDEDWYDYARSLANLEGSIYGIPFAGDTLMLVYRPSVVGDPPRSWTDSLEINGPFVFPAADAQSLYTLALYEAAGGQIMDETGRPILQAEPLSKVLTFYQQGASTGLMPPWMATFETDQQAWDTFAIGEANLVVTWTSQYFREVENLPEDVAAAPLPNLEGENFTLADGWVWAMANPDEAKRDLAVQLAEFLTESSFLSNWTYAAGYLPPRSSALSAWPIDTLQPLASQVVLSAHLVPSTNVLSSLGPELQRVTVLALQQEGDPRVLAESAVNEISQ